MNSNDETKQINNLNNCIMKQFTLKSLMLLLLLLIGGGSYVWGETWIRCTSVSDLISGGTFILGYEATANSGIIVPMQCSGTATATTAGYLNGGTEKTTGKNTVDMSNVTETSKYEVTIGASSIADGAVSIKCGDYFVGNNNEKNKLKLFSTETENTAFTPSVGKNDVFTLTLAACKTYNKLRYNLTYPRFACYSDSQKDVVIYKKNDGGDNTASLKVNTTSVDFGTVVVGASVESKNVTVTMANIEGGATAKLDKGEASPFAVTPESLSATGDVAVSPKAETLAAAGVYEDKLTITAGKLTKTVDVKLTVAKKNSVTWNVNGKVYTEGNPTTEVVEGEKVEVLPTAPASICGLVFMGWTNEAVTSQEAAPAVLFTSAADAPAVTADATYYAVFASQSGSMKWKKVSFANVDEGIYALITPDGHAFNGKIASGHGQATADAFIFDKSGVATSAPEGTLEVILSAKAGGYTMFNADKGYLYAKEAKSGNLDWDTKESGNWLYKEGQKEDNWLYDSNKAYLRCYKNTFRTYGYGAYDSISFVKKVSDISYSNYTTSAETLPLRAFDGKNHFATFSSDKAVKFVDATVYAVGVNDDRLILTEVESKQVPANTGVLLKSAGTEATYSVIGSAPAIENNLLCASVEEGQTTAADGTTEGYSFFKLSYNQAGENEKLGFYWAKENGAPFVSKAGLAYLAVKTADVAAVKGFSLFDMETGIIKVSGSAAGNGVIYDLQGRRVERAVRGLYIVNGRKVMVK